MPNNLKKMSLSEYDFAEMDKLKWVVTEKVHGANFSFVYENHTLHYAKRKEYLEWTDDFFGFQLVVNRLENNMYRLFEQLSADIPASKYMIYGELFGGAYPHPDIAPEKGLQAIQTGVYYIPGIDFCAFDIAIEKEENEPKYYLDYQTAVSYFQKFGIFHAMPLFIGKFNEAMNFNIRINSSVPKQFGLPELKNNLIEGVVIKPYDLKDINALSSRPILKLKNPEFDEEEKFHEAEKWSFIPDVISRSKELSFILDEMRSYITRNRLQSAVSKIGPMQPDNAKRMADIQQEFLSDTLADFNENNMQILGELLPEEKEWITERISSQISNLMRSA